MENINNTLIPETSTQQIESPIAPKPISITPQPNIFKYLFIVSVVILLIVIIFFIFVLNTKNNKDTSVQQNTNNISEITPTNIPTSTTISQPIENTLKPTLVFNDSKLIQLGYKLTDYDMNNVTKECNPCTQECKNQTTDEQNKITNFYNYLKQGNIADATSFLKNYIDNRNDDPHTISFLSTLFPICSAYHSLLGVTAQKNGITILSTSGNGYPSVPNDNYSFGYITVIDNKIKLYEKLINGYFSVTGDSYKQAMNSNDYTKAINILDSQSNDVANSMNSGVFGNNNIQQEFAQLINSVN